MKALLKILVKIIAVLALLFVAWLVYALAVNWRDQAPSATAIEFETYSRTNFPIDVENNGYAFLVGFDVPEDQEPLPWGEERITWSHNLRANLDPAVDIYEFPGAVAEFFAELTPGVELLNEHCRFTHHTCIQRVLENQSELAQTIKEGQWVIDRYGELLNHEVWVENIYFDARLPLPSYEHLLSAQRLYFVDIFLRKELLDPEVIGLALENDLIFWRRAQQDSAILITKMISLSAIRQNFYWTNQLLRHMPADQQTSVVSQTHQLPLNRQELSMYRVHVGEWVFGSRFMSDGSIYQYDLEFEESLHPLGRFLFQQQATLNLMAEQHATLARHTDQPLENYPEAVTGMEGLFPQESRWSYLLNPSNVVGRILVAVAAPAYGDYFVRVSDVEGLRRALILTSQLRQQQVPLDQVQEFLTNSDIRNPYTGEPFEWDEASSSVVFTGLQRGERGRHAYEY